MTKMTTKGIQWYNFLCQTILYRLYGNGRVSPTLRHHLATMFTHGRFRRHGNLTNFVTFFLMFYGIGVPHVFTYVVPVLRSYDKYNDASVSRKM